MSLPPLPPNTYLKIEFDPHALSMETVGEFMSGPDRPDWISEEEMRKAVFSNRMCVARWIDGINLFYLAAADEVALRAAIAPKALVGAGPPT